MMYDEFKSIVMTFVDPGSDLLIDKSEILISVNGILITAKLVQRSGELYINEGGGELSASKWIINRLAQLPLLAARLKEMIVVAENFVSPSANFLPTLESEPEDKTSLKEDALAAALKILENHSPAETTVLYLTSDAGEGKTSLINQLAKNQAEAYIERKTDWLLVPISLGGRHFLRFDDITVGALQNRYRFPFLYYNSFLALVKMGVIIPAFDGFEEMFVENNSGEAFTAMGILVSSLESKGSIVIAARKAYFEFENLHAQTRLFDSIRAYSVGFGKLELQRWEKAQFVAYCAKRKVAHPEELYLSVSKRLGAKHSLLTRAVLVKRLVDVAKASSSLQKFLEQLQQSGSDFFSVFIRGLIEREANEKWIDRSGSQDIGSALLTVDEHCELLSMVALEMWVDRVAYLKQEMLEFVADYFSELNRKSTHQALQIRNRLSGHSLLASSSNATKAVEFDHDKFREFFLGEGVAHQMRPLNDRAKAQVLSTFRREVLPNHTQQALISALRRDPKLDCLEVVQFLMGIAKLDARVSYTQGNCSSLIIQMLSETQGGNQKISDLSFGDNALESKKLTDLTFHNCFFSPTSLKNVNLKNCNFFNCKFVELRVCKSTILENVFLDNYSIDALVLIGENSEEDRSFWNPSEIRQHLEQVGVRFMASTLVKAEPLQEPEVDPEIRDFKKIIRYFMRSTHMGEEVMLTKLGAHGQSFLEQTLPELIRENVLQEIENRGDSKKSRFRLGIPLQKVYTAINKSRGSYANFLQQLKTSEP